MLINSIDNLFDKTLEIIKTLEPLLLIIVPACIGIYWKIRKKIKDEKEKLKQEDEEKAKEDFSRWEHMESLNVINKLKGVCDYYKDVGHMDLLNYVQFENGTTASSRLCNMFLTCIAEDSRYGKLPSMINNFQRISYGRLSNWVNKIEDSNDKVLLSHSQSEFYQDYSSFIPESDKIKSFISKSIRDPEGMLIGICSFFYTENDFCGRTDEQEIDLINKFAMSIETVFLEYHISRKNKKKELKLI